MPRRSPSWPRSIHWKSSTTPDYNPADPQSGVYYNSASPTGQPGLYRSTLTLDLPGGTLVFGTKPVSAYERFVGTSVIHVADWTDLDSPSGEFGTVSGDSLDFYHEINETIRGSYIINRVDTVEMLLIDSSGTAFNSDALPQTLDLADFDLAEIRYYKSYGTSFSDLSNVRTEAITAHFTSLTAVPEPSSLLIYALTGGLMLGRRDRRV